MHETGDTELHSEIWHEYNDKYTKEESTELGSLDVTKDAIFWKCRLDSDSGGVNNGARKISSSTFHEMRYAKKIVLVTIFSIQLIHGLYRQRCHWRETAILLCLRGMAYLVYKNMNLSRKWKSISLLINVIHCFCRFSFWQKWHFRENQIFDTTKILFIKTCIRIVLRPRLRSECWSVVVEMVEKMVGQE